MKSICLLTVIALCTSAHAADPCLSAGELQQVIDEVKAASVRYKTKSSASFGRGFVMNSPIGTEVISVHHTVLDSGEDEEESCYENANAPKVDPKKLEATEIRFPHNARPNVANYRFPSDALNMDYNNDLIKGRLSGPPMKGLTAETSGRPLTEQDEILIMGFPGNGSANFTMHSCNF